MKRVLYSWVIGLVSIQAIPCVSLAAEPAFDLVPRDFTCINSGLAREKQALEGTKNPIKWERWQRRHAADFYKVSKTEGHLIFEMGDGRFFRKEILLSHARASQAGFSPQKVYFWNSRQGLLMNMELGFNQRENSTTIAGRIKTNGSDTGIGPTLNCKEAAIASPVVALAQTPPSVNTNMLPKTADQNEIVDADEKESSSAGALQP